MQFAVKLQAQHLNIIYYLADYLKELGELRGLKESEIGIQFWSCLWHRLRVHNYL